MALQFYTSVRKRLKLKVRKFWRLIRTFAEVIFVHPLPYSFSSWSNLKYLNNFWKTHDGSLVSCQISLNLTWSSISIITDSTGEKKFVRTDTTLYLSVVTLSNQKNVRLFVQLKISFKRTINWNKYLPKVKRKKKSTITLLRLLVRLFVSLFESDEDREAHRGYYIPKVETKN